MTLNGVTKALTYQA